MKAIVNILYRLLFALIFLLGLYMLINGYFINHVIVKEVYQVTREHIDALIWIGVLVLLVVSPWIKVSRKHGLTILIVWITVLVLLSLTLKQSNPNDDSFRIVSDALKAYQNFPEYFKAWGKSDLYYMAAPWQIGMFILLLILNFISFGHGTTIYIGLNIISVYVMFYYLIKIIERLKQREIQWFLLVVLLGLWIVPIAYIPYVYGWQLGLGITIVGIYQSIKAFDEDSWKSFRLSIILLFIACMVKTNFMIVYIALILVNGMKWIKMHYDLKWLYKVGLTILFMGLSMMTPKWIVGSIIDQPVNGTPQLNMLTMGTQEGMFGPGWFNGYAFSVFYDNYGDPQANHDQVITDLKNRLNEFIESPHIAFDFYKRKLDSMVLTKDFQIHAYYNMNDGWGNHYLNQSPVREITYAINAFEYALIAIGLVTGAFMLLKHKGIDEKVALFGLLLCGGILYHLLFEAKAIYIYPWITMVLPLVYIGLDHIYQWCDSNVKPKYAMVIMAGSCLIIGSAWIYNQRPTEITQYEQYSNDQQVFWLKQGNYIDQPFYLDETTIIDSIQVMVSSYDLLDETIGLEIHDSNDEVIFSQYYGVNNIKRIDPFLSLDVKDLDLHQGQYTLYIYSDATKDSIGLTIGNQYDASFESFDLNGYDQTEILNLKIIGKIKANMTYTRIYDGLVNG